MQPTTKIYGNSADLAPGSTLSGSYQGASYQGANPITPTVASTAASPTAPTSFSLSIPNAIPTSVLGSNATIQGVYQQRNNYQSQLDEIQKQLAASQTASDNYQQQVLGLSGMSEQEQALQNQITGLNQSRRSEYAQLDKDGNLTLDQNAIQQQTRDKDYNLSILAKSENLANLTGVRQSKLNAITTALGFEDKRYERLLGLENKFRGLDKEEKTQARQDINDILTFAEGKSYEELDPESQLRIQQAVALTPFTLGQIQQAMDRMKVAYDEDRTKNALAIEQGRLGLTTEKLQQDSLRSNMATDALQRQKLQAELGQLKKIASGLALSDEDKKTVTTLADSYYDESKNFITIRDAYGRVNAADPSAAGDLSLIFAYMKMLDPNSVVREQEFANAQNAAGVPDRIRAQYNNVLNGQKLAETQRADFLKQAKNIYDTTSEQQEKTAARFTDRAKAFGLPEKAVGLITQGVMDNGADIPKLKAQLQPGEMLVRDKVTGQIGRLPVMEANPSKYEPL